LPSTDNRRLAVAYVVIALLLLIVLVLVSKLGHLSRQVPYYDSDANVIEAARRNFKAAHNATDYDIRNRFAVVIDFEEASCVELKSPRGFLSQPALYCFDRDLKPVEPTFRPEANGVNNSG
jgi:hypothetical protein